jgi:hypothetical protein
LTSAIISAVVGRGAPTLSPSPEELRVIAAEALDGIDKGERVLASLLTRPATTTLITPRYRITLASAVTEEACRRVNLGFLDYRNLRLEDHQAEPDTLVVDDSGRDPYLV